MLSTIWGTGVRLVNQRDEFFSCETYFLHEWANVYTKHWVLWVYEKKTAYGEYRGSDIVLDIKVDIHCILFADTF